MHQDTELSYDFHSVTESTFWLWLAHSLSILHPATLQRRVYLCSVGASLLWTKANVETHDVADIAAWCLLYKDTAVMTFQLGKIAVHSGVYPFWWVRPSKELCLCKACLVIPDSHSLGWVQSPVLEMQVFVYAGFLVRACHKVPSAVGCTGGRLPIRRASAFAGDRLLYVA